MDAGVCNSKQRLNEDRCRCKCKELIDNGRCDTGFIWNPSNCDCECDKSCDVGEYLDYQNCVRILKIVDKLVKECNEMNYNEKKFNIKCITMKSLYTVYIIHRSIYIHECGYGL